MKKLQQLTLLLALCLLSSGIIAQVQSTLDIAFRHLEDNQAEWGLNKSDISDMRISDHVFSKYGEIDHYYFMQRYNEIDIYNAISSVHVNKSGKVLSPRHNFIPNLASKINTTVAQKSEVEALQSVFKDLAIPAANFNFSPKNRSEGVTTFDKGTISNIDIKVKPIYQVVSDSEIKLAWDVTFDPADNADYWNIRVDAVDGAILDKTNFTIYCSFATDKEHTAHSSQCTDHSHTMPIVESTAGERMSSAIMSGTYNVFAEMIDGTLYPHESPVHGSRNLITDPSDPTASPFGWHDVDGVEGPEFNITRGNNVHAYLDVNDDNSPDSESDVNGGEELIFDFPWTDLENPENSEAAAVTNLFFMNNYIHDFTYAYGFDESAGNFQANNYSGEGIGNDYVRAEAQDGRSIHYDDPVNEADHVNNANFATPSDGASGRMQMFVWNRVGGRFLSISNPAAISGSYETATAAYGPAPVDSPIIDAEIAIALDDDVQNPTLVCGEVINPDDIAGKIAMIDRGGCTFVSKTLNAQNGGAIAVIICNFEDPAVGMAGVNGDITIPTIMLSNSDCNLIKSVINAGESLTASIGATGAEGADFYDGDVDNGIIAHEFGHGVSNRLVAGPSSAGCLGNGEQMGEGWSDFFTLVTTVKPGDVGTGKHGIGTYVQRETTTGNGIRSNAYSTDMNIDPETFGDLPQQAVPHGLGAVWNSMLWDLYWAFVDEYGFDDDILNGEGGNNIAVRLVMEGMKFTPCGPGFVDGRDAILAADEFLFDGSNTCLIWKTFARRGLGENANQGSTEDNADGIEDFNPPPGCVKEVKMSKFIISERQFPDVVEPGDAVQIGITYRNDKDEVATELVITDGIPAGATVSNISNGGEIMGDNIVWELGTVEIGVPDTITYTLTVDENRQSTTLFFDNLEENNNQWVRLSDSSSDPSLTENQFFLGSDNNGLGTVSGDNAYNIDDIGAESRENLLLIQEINVSGDNPALRFFQNFNTEAGADGTLLQYSTDGFIWEEFDSEFFKNGYPREIQYTTFVVPFLSAFSGNSNGWIDSWVDLSSFQGQTLLIRFRYGSDDNTEGIGWAMDDFEYLDVVSYNTIATLTTAEGDLIEYELPDRGIKINSAQTVAVDDAENPSLEFSIYPNPASDMVNIAINNITADNAQLSVYNYSGQLIEERKLNLNAGSQLEAVNVSNYPSGFYFFQLTTDRGIGVEKVMVGK